MSRLGAAWTLAALLLSTAAPAAAQQDFTQAHSDPVARALANADRLTARRTPAQCRREAAEAMARGDADIIVCAPRDNYAPPVPEVYGPVYGSTDGRAVDPTEPCGLSLQTPCFEGINLMAVAGFVADKLLDVFNPDRDLGPPTPIPDRFRGANR